MEAIYRQEGNPIYAWWAISFCRGRGRDIPGWCLEYLDRCADAIDHLANEPTAMSPAIKAAAAFKVFGFIRPGWNAFERFGSRQESARVAAALRKGLKRTKPGEQADTQPDRKPIKKVLAKQLVDEVGRSKRISRSWLYARAAKEKDSPTPKLVYTGPRFPPKTR